MEKTLYAKVSVKIPELCLDDEPEGIRVVVTDELAEQIRQLAKIVKDNQLYKVEQFHNWPEWLKESPEGHDDPGSISESDCRLECVTLNVGDDGFWYEAAVKHTDIELQSEWIPLTNLDLPEGVASA